MIEVFDTTAARIALTRRMLGCPGCGQLLRPWGHARERTFPTTPPEMPGSLPAS